MDILTQPILNVDDYAPGRYGRTRVLQQAGFTVIEASNGKEALALVDTHKPSLVLLDVNLPDINGFEVCREIRKNPKVTSTTILHISASNTQTAHQVRGLESGADGYLVEPVEPAVLIATIRAFLRARQAEESLRRSNEDLERFAYMVAHDLLEPLRTVMSHTQLLERQLKGKLDDSATERIRYVVEGAQRMRSFIDDMLLYSQATKRETALEAFDCQEMVGRITANLHASIRDSGAHVTHGSLPVVTADARLEHVFQNLISNAIKYRKSDVAPEVFVRAEAAGDFWRFSVQDNGVGIEPRHKDWIFHIFRRLHGREVPGNGIGLAMSQKIVESHGGSIWFESEPGVGSTFFFTLPRHEHATLES